jgi:hypothetical protein
MRRKKVALGNEIQESIVSKPSFFSPPPIPRLPHISSQGIHGDNNRQVLAHPSILHQNRTIQSFACLFHCLLLRSGIYVRAWNGARKAGVGVEFGAFM